MVCMGSMDDLDFKTNITILWDKEKSLKIFLCTCFVVSWFIILRLKVMKLSTIAPLVIVNEMRLLEGVIKQQHFFHTWLDGASNHIYLWSHNLHIQKSILEMHAYNICDMWKAWLNHFTFSKVVFIPPNKFIHATFYLSSFL